MEEQGKLVETYSFRVPERLKKMSDEFLTAKDKTELNEQFRLLIAKRIHHSIARQQFNPADYLGD